MRHPVRMAVLIALLVSLPSVPARARSGDVNGDGALDVSDAIVLLSHLFLGTDLGSPTSDPPELCFQPYLRPRTADEFIDNGNGTVTDTLTRLTWQKPPSEGPVLYDPDRTVLEVAVEYCEGLELAGRDDWRLPNIIELLSLNPAYCSLPDETEPCPLMELLGGLPANSELPSSTPVAGESGDRVYMLGYEGSLVPDDLRAVTQVVCVRGGLPRGTGGRGIPADVNTDGALDISDPIFLLQYLFSGGPPPDEESCLLATGVTMSIVSGDDGYYQAGIPQPPDRFADLGNGVVLDRVTDLKWLKTSSETHLSWIPEDSYLEEVERTTEIHTWHVPLPYELVSIVDFTRAAPAIHPIFEFRDPGVWWNTLARPVWADALCCSVVVSFRWPSCYCDCSFSGPPSPFHRLVEGPLVWPGP